MLSLRSRRFEHSLKDDMARVIMVDFPQPLQIAQGSDVALSWMAPDELLLLCPDHRTDQMRAALGELAGGTDVLITDVSDMRVRFSLSGQPLREVLARLTPADVSSEALPIGMFRRSRIGQVAAAFWLSADDQADVLCFRSVADYVEDVLTSAAAYAEPLGLY